MKVNLRIVPGESNISISLLFNEIAELLSFLQICLGQFRTFHDDLTIIPFVMTIGEHRKSDK